MIQYLQLLKKVILQGEVKDDRTGTGTRSLFGESMRFDLRRGFPLVTTKKVHMKAVIHELLWMLSGLTNIKYLKDNDVRIWDEWADANGELGPIYGKQWRSYGSKYIDQIAGLIHGLKFNPDSRRHIVTAWNPIDIPSMKLPPCHCFFQFYVHGPNANGVRGLSCQLYQRSADVFLGVPFNVASYAMLTMMIAQVCGYEAREFIHTFGDVHLYNNHVDQAITQLERCPTDQPRMLIDPSVTDIDRFRYASFELINYNPHPTIKAKVSM